MDMIRDDKAYTSSFRSLIHNWQMFG